MIHTVASEEDNLIAAGISDKNKNVDFPFELHNFYGYGLEGLWADLDLKLDVAHLSDYGNMAIVGEKIGQEWAVKASNSFSGPKVKYFSLEDKEVAKNPIGL